MPLKVSKAAQVQGILGSLMPQKGHTGKRGPSKMDGLVLPVFQIVCRMPGLGPLGFLL